MDIATREYLSDIRGFYTHGYFYIYLNGTFSLQLDNMSIPDLGTFFHEYVHFIQNISTLWGIKRGMTYNNFMCDLFNAAKHAKEIHIPFVGFAIDPKTKKELDFDRKTRGCAGEDSNKNWRIDTTQKIGISVRQDSSQNWPILLRLVYLDVKFQDGRTEQIVLGSTIVAESMAALCQSYIDPSSIRGHKDIPYNAVQILANQYFPELAKDTKKLICLCYIALFSMNPGWQLLDMMRYAEQHKEKSGIELFNEFINTTSLMVHGNSISVVEFFDSIIDGYKESIKGLLGEEVDYLKELFDRVRLSGNNAPLISILDDDEPIGRQHIKALIDYMSIPFVHTNDNFFYPTSANSPQGARDIAKLSYFYKIYEFLLHIHPERKKKCPFMELCAHDHVMCSDAPWKETNCAMEYVLKEMELYGKPIIYLDDLRNNKGCFSAK